MYDVELRRTEKILKRNRALGRLKDKEIFLFGVSDNTRQIVQILRGFGIEPKSIIDNDIIKQGSYCSRLKVIAFEEIENPLDDDKMYIIYSSYWREMVSQLKGSGIPGRRILRLYRESGLVRLLVRAIRGKSIYKGLMQKYGDVPIFLCPYTGTGDIYLIGTFWNAYIEKNNITDYTFVVIGGACRKVANLFDIRNIEVLKKKEYSSYLIYYYLCNPEKVRVKILNDCWAQVHSNQVEWFRGYKGLYFTQLFKKFVFDLPDDVKPCHPVLKDVDKQVMEIFNKHSLKPGRTVVLSPYSNTLLDLPDTFWEGIVEKLTGLGYNVMTNCGGKNEEAIKGTSGVFFSLDIAPQIIEKAGAFIGVRSGFCDVVSGSNAKKIILYDMHNRFYMGSAYEYFNLKDMELCDDAIEIQFDVGDLVDLENRIMIEFYVKENNG